MTDLLTTLSFLFLLTAIHTVAADSGDDLSNNLFTDLAPLLTLFGERFAQQFLSEAFNWLDHIIFAMAPLGILTAIIGAIRIGGPSWLKATIGRARENRAIPEVELMSSTSHEVCELWNGDAVVRTLGRPQVKQLVLLPRGEAYEISKDEVTFGLFTLGEAEEKGVMRREKYKGPFIYVSDWIMERVIHRRRNRDELEEGLRDGESEQKVKEPNDKIASKNQDRGDEDAPPEEAPNILLNLHHGSKISNLVIAAVAGILLQVGVLVFSGFIVYHKNLKQRFGKDGKAVETYGYPILAIGTAMLAIGMILCSFIIEQGTKEEVWIVNDKDHKLPNSGTLPSSGVLSGSENANGPQRSTSQDLKTHVLWLQKKHTVGDQNFESYVLWTENPSPEILTSRRSGKFLKQRLPESKGNRQQSNVSQRNTTRGNRLQENKPWHNVWRHYMLRIASTRFEVLTIVATVIGLAGFVLQFQGFRAMNWVCSILQLSATLIMTVLRAWVRRGLILRPQSTEVSGGHEMDWIAIQMAQNDSWPQVPVSKDVCDWKVLTGTGSSAHFDVSKQSGTSKAEKAMKIRQRLGSLTNWMQASQEAISAAIGVEIVLNTLVPPSSIEDSKFHWSLEVNFDGKQIIRLTVWKEEGAWHANASEIEAVLSLWLYSIQRDTSKHQEKNRQNEQRNESDDWLRRRDVGLSRRFRQLLGRDTPTLQRDLDWWIGDKVVPESREIEKKDDKDLLIGLAPMTPEEINAASQASQNAAKIRTLEVKSSAPIKLFLAQHIFSAFMWAIAEKVSRGLLAGKTTFDPMEAFDIHNHKTWNLCRLENTLLTGLVKDIQRTSLGTFEEMLMLIVPPLSHAEKLPDEEMVEFIMQKARKHEITRSWEEAQKIYHELLCMILRDDTSRNNVPQRFECKALAAVNQIRPPTKDANEGESDIDEKIEKIKSSWEGLGPALNDRLRRIASICQQRKLQLEKGSIIEELHQVPEDLLEMFGCTPLHQEVIKEISKVASQGVLHNSDQRNYMKAGDIFGWTPLHYAVVGSKTEIFPQCIEVANEPNYKDMLGRTPLHYAAMLGRNSFLESLLKRNAAVDAPGRDGMRPLHWAARLGKSETVKKLLQKKLNVNSGDIRGKTALQLAAANGHYAVVKLLLEKDGVDPDSKDKGGQTPLSWAAKMGYDKVVRLLLEKKGVDPDSKDKGSQTPLSWAAQMGHDAVVRLLLEKNGVNPDSKDKNGQTPLSWAAQMGYDAVVKLLLEKEGVDPDSKDKNGRTPLSWAARMGHGVMVKLLLEKEGVDPDSKDKGGRTPLLRAAKMGHDAVVKLLLEKESVDPDSKDLIRRTPLSWAAQMGHDRVVKLLLEKESVDLNSKDWGSRTPLLRAAKMGYDAVVKLLLEKESIDPNSKDEGGRTPLSWAVEMGHDAVVKLLLEKRAST